MGDYHREGSRNMPEINHEYLENLATLLAEVGGAAGIPGRTDDLSSRRSLV